MRVNESDRTDSDVGRFAFEDLDDGIILGCGQHAGEGSET